LVENYKNALTSGVSMITETVNSGIKGKISSNFGGYPKLKEVVLSLLKRQVEINADELNKNLRKYLDAQKAFVNTKHPDFSSLPDGNKEQYEKGHYVEDVAETELPQDELSATNWGKELHKGEMTLRKAKVLVAVTEMALSIFADEEKYNKFMNGSTAKPMKSFPLNDIAIEFDPSYDTKNRQKFVIKGHDMYRSNTTLTGKTKDIKPVEFLVAAQYTDEWIKKFEQLEIFTPNHITNVYDVNDEPKLAGESTSAKPVNFKTTRNDIIRHGNNVMQEFKSDPQNRSNVDEVRVIVDNYMRIVHKSIKDMSLKYIIRHLVLDVNTYVQEDLDMDIERSLKNGEDSKLKLLEPANDRQTKIDKLANIKDATMKALESLHQI